MSNPKIGEKAIATEVQAVLRNGGGSNAERACVAVGLIESRVRRAYDLDADEPMYISRDVIAGYETELRTKYIFAGIRKMA